jgi:ribosome recycling factor
MLPSIRPSKFEVKGYDSARLTITYMPLSRQVDVTVRQEGSRIGIISHTLNICDLSKIAFMITGDTVKFTNPQTPDRRKVVLVATAKFDGRVSIRSIARDMNGKTVREYSKGTFDQDQFHQIHQVFCELDWDNLEELY